MAAIKWIFLSVSLFAFSCSFLQGHSTCSSHHHESHKTVKYVQGGACYSGKGTKSDPFATLADAEADTTWDVLVVLPSTVALDGGITLRSGTKLIGAGCDPTCAALATNAPTITNTSSDRNGGNGVVVVGDAVIGNIYIKDTWASAINFDDGRNLTIKQVLITGHNQGSVFSPIETAVGETLLAGGIHGQPTNDGHAILEKVIIRNNYAGSGVINIPYQGAKRHLFVNNSEFAYLTSRSPFFASLLAFDNNLEGITAAAIGAGTSLHTDIKNSYFHDFQPQDFTSNTIGINTVGLNGGETNAKISCCRFYKIGNSNQALAIHIHAQALTDIGAVEPGIQSKTNTVISSCLFEEPSENSHLQITAAQLTTMNAESFWKVKNCTSRGIYDTFISFIEGSGTQEEKIIGNTATGANVFFAALTNAHENVIEDPKRITKVQIEGNVYTGGSGLGAIAVRANFNGGENPWHRLRICAEDNCFDGQGSGYAGLSGTDFGSGGAGDAVISAHNNSIVGYAYDILDDIANVTYYAEKNWWGQSSSCTIGADCTPTQSCSAGNCVGPDNVVNNGTGEVDVSHPLTSSIRCPGKCHVLLQGTNTPT